MSVPYAGGYLGLGNSFTSQNRFVGGWKELARTTLGSSGSSIDVSSLPNKRYYQVLYDLRSDSGVIEHFQRFNGIATGTPYAVRSSPAGGADTTEVSQNQINYGGFSTNAFQVCYIANLSTREKLTILHSSLQQTAGATNAPSRTEGVAKWDDTTNPIDQITAVDTRGTGDYDTGSEVVVLGWDPDDNHLDNFWQELASVNASGSVDSFDTGVFTSKKYLWVQVYANSSSGNATMQVGNTTLDTGNNYADRGSDSGGTDFTETESDHIQQSSSDDGVFLNVFIVNNATEEKLATGHSITVITTGSGTAPKRREYVGKWANTSDLIDIIGVFNTAATNYNATSQITVWGHD